MKTSSAIVLTILLTFVIQAGAQTQSTKQPALPYFPSLDVSSMDQSVDPCVDLYHYACGGWQKKNPIPPDQTSWSVYGKLYEDNLSFLRGMLEKAATSTEKRDINTQKIGDFYKACMDEGAVEKRGISPIESQLDEIAQMKAAKDLAPLVARLQLVYGRAILFSASSAQDLDNSEQVIADLDQGGLGLPDRDYYTKDDDKSKKDREHYLQHVQKIFELLGDHPDVAARNASTVMTLETRLAQASLTRVERRDPYKLKHKLRIDDLARLAPKFEWKVFYHNSGYPDFSFVNVDTPEFFKEVNALLNSELIENWKTYLRFHVTDSASPYLSAAFVQENFEFYRKYLRGVVEQQPRWKRCVTYVDQDLEDALGQVYVAQVFSPGLKQSTLHMVQHIEAAMQQRIQALDWMSPETKKQALLKLKGIRNKIGYPEKWRDYHSLQIAPDDFAGNMLRASEFERHRQINKIGKPVDHTEWQISATTVDAYYDPQMNDINFPAGVLQPPLYDAKMDDAPNYGDTGGTIGHELTHAFDDEGSQFDATGNLRNWWTAEDRKKFEERTSCVANQYAQYVPVDDLHINSRLTLGEDVADLGGELLSFMAWKDATRDQNLQSVDGLTPEQRFFIGFAQWDCANLRPEELRVHLLTNPHSPSQYRINGGCRKYAGVRQSVLL